MSAARAKGTAAETAVVRLLKATHWPYAERRALSGGQDKGDTTGHPGFILEVKAAKNHTIPAWLRETEIERVNDNAEFGILVIKPQKVGVVNTRLWTTVMTQGEAERLWRQAGSPPRAEQEHSGQRFHIRPWLAASNARRELLSHDFGWSTARPRGVKDWADFHNYMYLDQRLELLHLAGYGDRRQEHGTQDS